MNIGAKGFGLRRLAPVQLDHVCKRSFPLAFCMLQMLLQPLFPVHRFPHIKKRSRTTLTAAAAISGHYYISIIAGIFPRTIVFRERTGAEQAPPAAHSAAGPHGGRSHVSPFIAGAPGRPAQGEISTVLAPGGYSVIHWKAKSCKVSTFNNQWEAQ